MKAPGEVPGWRLTWSLLVIGMTCAGVNAGSDGRGGEVRCAGHGRGGEVVFLKRLSVSQGGDPCVGGFDGGEVRVHKGHEGRVDGLGIDVAGVVADADGARRVGEDLGIDAMGPCLGGGGDDAVVGHVEGRSEEAQIDFERRRTEFEGQTGGEFYDGPTSDSRLAEKKAAGKQSLIIPRAPEIRRIPKVRPSGVSGATVILVKAALISACDKAFWRGDREPDRRRVSNWRQSGPSTRAC
jgi:hypothetical protein